MVLVVEAQPLVVAGRGGDRRQVRGRDRRGGGCDRDGRVVQRSDATVQVRREHLLELGQRAQGGLLDGRHAPTRGRRAQPDRDGDRLLVIEQQRRERRP